MIRRLVGHALCDHRVGCRRDEYEARKARAKEAEMGVVDERDVRLRSDAVDAMEAVRRMLGYSYLPESERAELRKAEAVLSQIAIEARERLEAAMRADL